MVLLNLHCDLQAMFPMDTLLVFRSGAPGAWGRCNDLALSNWNIHQRHIYQLNAAAKGALLRHQRWHLLDVESLVAEFVCPEEYLRDHAHYNHSVIWAILNLYLNMLQSFWQVHGLPAWRQNF